MDRDISDPCSFEKSSSLLEESKSVEANVKLVRSSNSVANIRRPSTAFEVTTVHQDAALPDIGLDNIHEYGDILMKPSSNVPVLTSEIQMNCSKHKKEKIASSKLGFHAKSSNATAINAKREVPSFEDPSLNGSSKERTIRFDQIHDDEEPGTSRGRGSSFLLFGSNRATIHGRDILSRLKFTSKPNSSDPRNSTVSILSPCLLRFSPSPLPSPSHSPSPSPQQSRCRPQSSTLSATSPSGLAGAESNGMQHLAPPMPLRRRRQGSSVSQTSIDRVSVMSAGSYSHFFRQMETEGKGKYSFHTFYSKSN
ncbi:unnamed protein product [Protopolystoma xenopodis]|uniref:Uncharacterized protein n=1 Tax=Protopolystoma xenopodis TaxID=117903 RepID=A0A3S5AEC5_9PLAT|nr:unnamed protein product [Protopolystoma xenopodis]